jgi:hypothetical protein
MHFWSGSLLTETRDEFAKKLSLSLAKRLLISPGGIELGRRGAGAALCSFIGAGNFLGRLSAG